MAANDIQIKSGFNLDTFFMDFMKKDSIFRNREALTSHYVPEKLPHRSEELRILAEIMACTLKNSAPSNVLIYGKTGTGKTAVVKTVSGKLGEICAANGLNPPVTIYINCNKINSEYRIYATICNILNPSAPVPKTGLPKDVLIDEMISRLNTYAAGSVCFIILDEIDYVVGSKGRDGTLYTLTRLNETLENAKISLIGISNVLNFKEDLDPRVCSSLSDEELVFAAYNATQLYDILKARAEIAFAENTVTEGALRLCAAYAAKEDGDARRALSLLRKAGEIAERKGLGKIDERLIKIARERYDRDTVVNYLQKLPPQLKAVVLAIYLNHKYKKGAETTTGEIYSTYCEIQAANYGINRLTPRRVADLIKELDMAGIVSSYVKSFGKRGGRTRVVSMKCSEEQIRAAFAMDPTWSEFLSYVPMHIRRNDILIYGGKKYRKLI